MTPDSSKSYIMIVDDEPIVIEGLQMMLESHDLSEVLPVTDSRFVLEILEKKSVQIILLDLNMPYVNGHALLDDITTLYPDIPVIIVTGYNDVDIAISCIKAGAFDYLVKPVDDARLSSSVNRAVEYRELKSEYAAFKHSILKNSSHQKPAFNNIITVSQVMFNLFKYAETIAPTGRPVLISGETGTGKELMAKAVHTASGRLGPFVSINVAGLDEQMFSDTLFGHIKGAFTGANEKRAGLIEKAINGTLFLDEIGDLDLLSQVKLLRLLQENEYFPIGADAPVRAQCKIVVATNIDLKKAQQNGRFRSDLYYRLRTHHIEIPPLREHPEDIPLLVWHFIQKAAHDLNKKPPHPPAKLSDLLSTYPFPGNIRELEAIIFEAVNNHQKGIMSMKNFKNYIKNQNNDLSTKPNHLESKGPFSMIPILPRLNESRQMLINEAMKRSNGNQTIAAQMLGISRSGLNKALSRNTKSIKTTHL